LKNYKHGLYTYYKFVSLDYKESTLFLSVFCATIHLQTHVDRSCIFFKVCST